MHIDNRKRNEYFATTSANLYACNYGLWIATALSKVDLKAAVDRIRLSNNSLGRIFVGGNGGSAAISDHLACDFEKGAEISTHSLVGRTALFTAIANDLGYDQTFKWQLERSSLTPLDTVILISSSGNSPNIVEAAKFTKAKHAKLIGFTGFDGGELKKLSDISVHVDANNYGIIEDCHQAIMHIIAQYIYLQDAK